MIDKGFITGESYQIKDIFSEDRKIVIPDLQRDYCWGSQDEFETNRVWKFVNSHYKLYKDFPDTISQIGLIYGYQDLSGRIMLCDGQQRLTTLFLLIGMINRKLEDNPFKYNLISKRELEEDDQEPYLQYAIRETSLSFISSLVTEFFLSKKISKVNEINTKLFWFYDQYNLDPTVKSMLYALNTIESFLENINREEAFNFGHHIINNLEVMYYDMESRANGEETFVIINTSGEPLTGMENLKPFMVKNLDDCDKWEDMDNWFWKNRQKFDTSTPGMCEFFRCVMYLEKNTNDVTSEEKNKYLSRLITKKEFTFPYEEISFNTVIEYFKSYKRLQLPTIYETIQEHKVYAWLIPSLLFAKRFPDASEKDIKRITHALRNTTRYRNDYKLKEAIILVQKMSSPDILSWLKLKDELDNYDRRKELSSKLTIIKNNPLLRDTIEKTFADAEQHGVWHGEIKILIDWAGGIDSFDLSEFTKFYDKSVILFGDSQESNKNTCISTETLRLLLAYKIAYVMMWGRCLRDAGVDWKQTLKDENKVDEFYKLLNDIDSTESINDKLKNYDNKQNFYYPIIKEKEWLANSLYRDIRRINTYLAVIKHRCQQKENFKDIFLVGQSELDSWIHPNDWSRFYYNNEYIYTRNNEAKVGINIHGDKSGLYFYVYTTKDDKTLSSQLKHVIETGILETGDNVYFKSQIYDIQDSPSFIKSVYDMMNLINES